MPEFLPCERRDLYADKARSVVPVGGGGRRMQLGFEWCFSLGCFANAFEFA